MLRQITSFTSEKQPYKYLNCFTNKKAKALEDKQPIDDLIVINFWSQV